MDALISGQAGIAILLHGNTASVVEAGRPEIEFSRHQGSIPYLFAGASDVIELKSVTRAKTAEQLKLASSRDQALHLALILLDKDETEETRGLAVESLGELLAERDIFDFIASRLYSAPAPPNSSLKDAQHMAREAEPLSGFLDRLERDQAQIRLYRQAWDNLPLEFFGSLASKMKFEHCVVDSGAFRRLVEAQGEPERFGLARFQCLSDLKNLPNSRAALDAWLRPFQPSKPKRTVSDLAEEPVNAPRKISDGRRPSGSRVSAREAFENVSKQKEAIVALFGKGELHRARTYIDQLVETQMKVGGPKYLSMSLCDLAQKAKMIFDHSLQLELARRAVEVEPDDGWAHGQVADAYFCLGQFDNAWQAFDTAGKMGEPAFGRSGQARILRAQGNLKGALAAYEQLIGEFPEEVVVWNGRAEVLREMWRLNEALVAYEEAIERFPAEVVPRCGRAAVLKDLGRLNEALMAYEQAIDEFGDDAVPYAGRADVLKEMGLLDDSEKEYTDAIGKFPKEPVPRCGIAEVFRERGQFGVALKYYEETTRLFPFNPVPWSGRAEVLKEMGQLDEALAGYNEAIEKFPFDPRMHNGKASVLKKMARLEEALQAYEQNTTRFPYDIYARSGRADLLKELGYLKEAVDAYDILMERNPNKEGLQYSKAAILAALGRYEEASRLLPSGEPRTHDEWVAYHIQGMILLKTNKLDLAIAHLQRGLRLNPFARGRRYFENALAVATVRRKRAHEAVNFLGKDQEPLTDVLRMHVFGELSRFEDAHEAYHRIKSVCPPKLVPLRDEVAARYRLQQAAPAYQPEWLFEEECRFVLLEAA